MKDYLMDLMVALAAAGFMIMINNIRKKLNTVLLRQDAFEACVADFKVIVEDNKIQTNTSRAIDKVVDNSLMALGLGGPQNNNDIRVMHLLMIQGEMAKDCLSWAMKTGLKDLSSELVRAKLQMYGQQIRDFMVNLEPEYSEMIRADLKKASEEHIEKVVALSQDVIMPDKISKFVPLTLYILHEVVGIIVVRRIQYRANVISRNREKS